MEQTLLMLAVILKQLIMVTLLTVTLFFLYFINEDTGFVTGKQNLQNNDGGSMDRKPTGHIWIIHISCPDTGYAVGYGVY
ncbi:MAG: hypothetical protein U5J96_17120 [Ignavibacteriaceae bacterium]|nr:hypothetical protein [Ignavibacteriaceae bacterium]